MVRFLRTACEAFDNHAQLDRHIITERILAAAYIPCSICIGIGTLTRSGVIPYASNHDWHLFLASSIYLAIANCRDLSHTIRKTFLDKGVHHERINNSTLLTLNKKDRKKHNYNNGDGDNNNNDNNSSTNNNFQMQMQIFSCILLTLGSLSLLNSSIIATITKNNETICYKQLTFAFALMMIGSSANGVSSVHISPSNSVILPAQIILNLRMLLTFQHVILNSCFCFASILMLPLISSSNADVNIKFNDNNELQKNIILFLNFIASLILVLSSIMNFFYIISFLWWEEELVEYQWRCNNYNHYLKKEKKKKRKKRKKKRKDKKKKKKKYYNSSDDDDYDDYGPGGDPDSIDIEQHEYEYEDLKREYDDDQIIEEIIEEIVPLSYFNNNKSNDNDNNNQKTLKDIPTSSSNQPNQFEDVLIVDNQNSNSQSSSRSRPIQPISQVSHFSPSQALAPPPHLPPSRSPPQSNHRSISTLKDLNKHMLIGESKKHQNSPKQEYVIVGPLNPSAEGPPPSATTSRPSQPPPVQSSSSSIKRRLSHLNESYHRRGVLERVRDAFQQRSTRLLWRDQVEEEEKEGQQQHKNDSERKSQKSRKHKRLKRDKQQRRSSPYDERDDDNMSESSSSIAISGRRA